MIREQHSHSRRARPTRALTAACLGRDCARSLGTASFLPMESVQEVVLHGLSTPAQFWEVLPEYVTKRGLYSSWDWDTDSFVAKCNASHATRYSLATSDRSVSPSAIHVHIARSNDVAPRMLTNRTNVLYTNEMYPHIHFASTDQFSDMLSSNTTPHYTNVPHMSPWDVFAWSRALQYAPKTRTSIGIWVESCEMAKTRLRIIDTLMSSGLSVESFGACRNNQNATRRHMDIRVQHIRDAASTPQAAQAAAECRSHRIMLAVEQRLCTGWIANNLRHVLHDCGAIPLVLSHGETPGYEAYSFPHIDAGEKGWLQLVYQIMTDDAFYERFLSTRRKPPQVPRTQFNCNWHELRQATNSTRRRVAWPSCMYCRQDGYEDPAHTGISLGHTPIYYECNTTSAWAWGDRAVPSFHHRRSTRDWTWSYVTGQRKNVSVLVDAGVNRTKGLHARLRTRLRPCRYYYGSCA